MSHARILVVDDEPFARQTLSEWLRGMDFHVYEAESGRQAMETIRRDEPDIVISDVVMPGMDGIQLLREARAVNAEIPFLMISGYPSHSIASSVMKHGASDYLPKPFTPEVLTHLLGSTIKLNSLSKRLAPVKGMILGSVISAILWALAILALADLFY